MDLTPPTLEGAVIRLEPLDREHLERLCVVGLEPELWRLTPMRVQGPADLERFVDQALADQAAGTALPFVTVACATGEVIGSTRFGNVVPVHRRVEIGWTWLAPAWQRTGANTEAKYLMLRYAFERLGCLRVEFKTNVLNERSRTALRRLGAVEEGVLRRHMINEDGSVRDTVYYSILADEWLAVKARLEQKLAAFGIPAS